MDSDIESACTSFWTDLESFIFSLCKEARLREPKKVAKQMIILLDGAIVYSQALRDPKIISLAKDMARNILNEN